MSHEAPSTHQLDPNRRLQYLKHLTDRLISLAPFGDEPTIEHRSQTIIDEMRSMSVQPVAKFSRLERLAELSTQHPEEPQLRSIIDDTAEHLLEEIDSYRPAERKNLENLSTVWSSIKAWDTARSKATAELCVKMLNGYPGEGQARLAEAYMVARDNDLDFDEALDSLNQSALESFSSQP